MVRAAQRGQRAGDGPAPSRIPSQRQVSRCCSSRSTVLLYSLGMYFPVCPPHNNRSHAVPASASAGFFFPGTTNSQHTHQAGRGVTARESRTTGRFAEHDADGVAADGDGIDANPHGIVGGVKDRASSGGGVGGTDPKPSSGSSLSSPTPARMRP
jgi:hypothetical protein